MLAVPAEQIRLEIDDAQFAVGGRNRNHFRSGEAFERAALVGLNVRGRWREDRLPRPHDATERDDVRARAVEREIHVGLLAEVRFEARDRAGGPRIVAVADGVARRSRRESLA